MQKNYTRCLGWFGLIALIACLLLEPDIAAASQAFVSISPQSVRVDKPGSEVTVDLQVADVAKMGGIDFQLIFDPTVVEVKDVISNQAGVQIVPGTIFSGSSPVLPVMNKVDNSAGTIWFAQVLFGSNNSGFTGTGSAARITFVAKKSGSTELRLTQVKIADVAAGVITAVLTDGELSVGTLPANQGSGEQPAANQPTTKPPVNNQATNNQTTNNQTNNGQPTTNQPTPNQPIGNQIPNQTTNQTNNQTTNQTSTIKDLSGHWAQPQVERLVGKKIINGYSDGTFRPNQSVTRAEFIKMVCLAVNLRAGNTSGTSASGISATGTSGTRASASDAPVFADSSEVPAWVRTYINAAYAKGIIKGDSQNRIRADERISRAEIVAILVRALGLESLAKSNSQQLTYTDQVPAWAQGYIGVAGKHNIAGGFPDQTFRADKFASRAEAAVMISRMLDLVAAARA